MQVEDIQIAMEEEIAATLAEAIGEIRAAPGDGCSADAILRVQAGNNTAFCDVSVSASAIVTEIDAVAEAGALRPD